MPLSRTITFVTFGAYMVFCAWIGYHAYNDFLTDTGWLVRAVDIGGLIAATGHFLTSGFFLCLVAAEQG